MPGFLKRLLIVGPLFAIAYFVAAAIYPAFSGPDGVIWAAACDFADGELVTRRGRFICSGFASFGVSGGLGVLVSGFIGFLALKLYLAKRS